MSDVMEPVSPMEGVVEGELEVPQVIYSVPLLKLVLTARAQNGVKHGEYTRYRKHCTNKMAALAKLLKFQHGRTKFAKRRIDAETVTDERFIHVLLFSAERAWSYATEMKKANETKMKLRRRDHCCRRLKKAAHWAGELVRVGADVCDERTQLEADAYEAFLLGSLLMEREKEWVAALSKLERARMLFEELGKVVSIEEQTTFLHMVEQTEPAIRYCSYQLERSGGGASPSREALLQQSTTPGRRTPQELAALLAQLAAASLVNKGGPEGAQAVALEWAGRKFAVRGDRVRACLTTAAEVLAAAAATPESGKEEAVTSALAKYARAIAAYSEARSHVRNSLQGSSLSEGEPAYEELAQLDTAIQGTSLQASVSRQALLAADSEARFAAGLERTALGKRAQEKDKYARAEEVVAALDALGRALGELGEMGARLGGRAGESLHDAATAAGAGAHARRAYYVAQALLAGGKPLEAYAMLSRTESRIADARAQLSSLPAGATQAPAAGTPPGPAVGAAAALDATDRLVPVFRAVAHADAVAAGLKNEEAVQAGLGSMGLAEAQLGSKGGAYLLDSLESWSSFAGQPGAKAPRLHRHPYAMSKLPMQPIMLDTASTYVAYPSVDHRARKTAAGIAGMASSLFGWGAKGAKK